MKARAFSLLLHARSKVGKSTLTTTAPLPMCVLDAEGGWRFLKTRGFRGQPLRHRYVTKDGVAIYGWDPMKEPPPRYDGTWDVCVVTVTGWQPIPKVLDLLTQQKHDFKTVCLDSITEMQRRCKANLGAAKMEYQQWGELLDRMDAVIRGYRDLTLIDNNSIECVVLVAETRPDNAGILAPYMQGQIQYSLPYWVDVCGFMQVQMEDDPTTPNGAGKRAVRVLRVGAHPQVVAGERVQGLLDESVHDPNISRMMDTIFGASEPSKETVKA